MLDFKLLDDSGEPAADDGGVEELSRQEIAIIGISAHLPLADDLDRLWELLSNGADFVSAFPEGRRRDVEPFAKSRSRAGAEPSYFDGAYLDEIDRFDYSFFRLSPREASLMTPNQRLFLQTAWRAIEDAGYGRTSLAGSRTGVFVGFNADSLYDYKRMITDTDPELMSLAVAGNLSSVIAGRISYLLDLNGPSLCVDTACSSSLVAVHLACQAIRNEECEMAIAGSVKINLLPIANEVKIGIESSSARARSFDDGADGTGAGEGVIAFVLKPLSRALLDGDPIHAVIKGSAVNQDGSSVGLSAPNVAAQEEVLAQAWDNAGIHPESLSYLEAHGTGTKLGDPIEIAGIDRAFRRFTDRRQFVALGAVKANIGHLDHAAGAMGLLKAVLALKRKQLPPLAHFARPNRAIDFLDSPVYVNDRLTEWTTDGGPRRCGVSAFGLSGTNCHLVLEEAPEDMAAPWTEETAERQGNVLPLSAKSEEALRELVGLYAARDWGGASLEQICYTAQTGRDHHEHRLAIVATDRAELERKLALLAAEGVAERGADGIRLGSIGPAAAGAAVPVYDPAGQGLDEIARSYASGEEVRWERLYAGAMPAKLHLPAYPFERHRCWLELPSAEALAAPVARPESAAANAPAVELIGGADTSCTATELALAQIWGEVLGYRRLRREDNFFELGGDSILALKVVNRLQSQLGTAVKVADLFVHPTLGGLASYADSLAAPGTGSLAGEELPLVPADPAEHYPLTSSQLRLFVQEQLEDMGTANHSPFCVWIDGPLDADRAQEAFRQLVARHEALRTSFAFADGEAVQRVAGHADFRIERSGSPEERVHERIEAFVRPFDLARPPLMRAGLVQVRDDRHLLMIDLHHIVSDGVSSSLLLREFGELYAGRPLPELRIQYKDYAVWQQRLFASGARQGDLAYWRERLAGELPALRLPTDFPRADRKRQAGRRLRVRLPSDLQQRLEELAKGSRMTMNALLFAIYGLLLYGATGQDGFVVGTLTAGREHPELEHVFGMFINFLPVRLRVRREQAFADYLRDVGRAVGEAYAHDYPFDRLITELRLPTDRSRNPLYDTMFVYHNEMKLHALDSARREAGGLTLSEHPLELTAAPLDVKLDVWPEADGGLSLVLEYDTALFAERTAARLLSSYVEMAEWAASDPARPLAELPAALATAQEESVLRESAAAYAAGTSAAAMLATAEAPALTAIPAAQTPEERGQATGAEPSLATAAALKVAVSATFTAEPIAAFVDWWCRRFGLQTETVFAPYHQALQELLDPRSLLSGNDGANVLLVRFEDWIREDDASVEARIAKLESIYGELTAAFAGRKTGAAWFVGLFPTPDASAVGGRLAACLADLNRRWREFLARQDRVFAVELDESVAEAYLVPEIYDPVKDREGHAPFTDEFYAAIGTELARKLVAWKKPHYKVIVLDCDNTLWRGVCGEDGPEGVVVSEPYRQLQRFMLERSREGMLLAISSKNNEADVWETFAKHPDMALRREHIVASRIGWGSKPAAVRELAEQLGLGLDSFIFLDDSAMECAEMMSQNPSVLTLQLPSDERQIPAYLQHVWAFDRLVVTDEDRTRTSLYAAEEQRRQYREEAGDSMEAFLRGLKLRIGMAGLRSDQWARAAQLTQRTNQFNLNPIRRTEEELAKLIAAPDWRVWGVEVEDRFGAYGFVGLVMGRIERETFVLDTFLLSCRVLGRGVERAIAAELQRYAAELGLRAVEARFVATKRNAPFREFLETAGWTYAGEADGTSRYRLEAGLAPAQASYATLLREHLQTARPEAKDTGAEREDSARHPAEADVGGAWEDSARRLTEADVGEKWTGSEWRLAEAGEQGESGARVGSAAVGSTPAAPGAAEARAGSGPVAPAAERNWHRLEAYEAFESQSEAGHWLTVRYASADLLLRAVRQAVPPAANDRKAAYEAPANETERELATLWEELLGTGPVGANDSFFDIGGNSLQAVSLASRIYKRFRADVSLRDMFAVPTVRALAARIRRTGPASAADVEPIEPVADRDAYPVTSAQRRLLVLEQLDGADTAYNQPCFFEAEGPFDRDRFAAACETLVRRHESLRTAFRWNGEQYAQVVAPEVEFAVECRELDGIANGSLPGGQLQADEQAVAEAMARFVRPFDTSRAPLFRSGLLRTGEQRWLLMFDMHHLISDGVSIGVMIRELLALYRGEVLPAPRLQYRDFAVWQERRRQSAAMEAHERFWLDQFADEAPVLNLPLDAPRPAVRGNAGRRVSAGLDRELAQAVRGLARETGATPYMVFLAAYNVLLAKYTGQQDIVVGSPAAGRPHADLDAMIGMFVHTIALRNRPAGTLTFRGFIGQVKENALRAFEHQEYPFDDLVERLSLPRDLSRHPLFDTMFVYQNLNWPTGDNGELRVRLLPHDTGRSRFDLTLELAEEAEDIRLNVEYATGLFRRPTMERLIRHYVNILRQAVQTPDLPLARIDMLEESERARLLFGFNATQADYEPERTMQSMFEEQARLRPDAGAVVCGDVRLTYAQLNGRANRLAAELNARGAGPGQLVGIALERSPEMVVAVLGALKAGAAYVPLDPQYPEERIRFMLEDSGASLAICHRHLAARLPDGVRPLIAEELADEETSADPPVRRRADDPAYVIYTSGSTGTPKGVMVEHRGMVNLQVYFQRRLQVTSADRIAQFASFSFDASVWEMFMALFNGAELHVLTPETIHDYGRMERYLSEKEITIATLPPTYLAGLNPSAVRTLRKVITAGSASTPELLEKWRGAAQYINAYGPTEATICATVWEAPTAEDGEALASVPIGTPIPNAQAYIVSADGQLQPVGVPGELCIGGAGLARGYWNRPELTAKHFVANPFVPGTRMYRTGDLAKWRPDGTIEYLGRLDHQVKVRGYRIELGEVEGCLARHPGVAECLVASYADPQGGTELCAYVGASGEAPSAEELRAFLRERLPEYMVPAYIVVLDKLPLTPNGKVDRKALPEPARERAEGAAPTNELERRLVRLWSEVLGIEGIGIRDHFFELGGHSLKAIALLTRIHREIGVELTLKHIFQSPTVELLARSIPQADSVRSEPIPAAPPQEVYPLTSGQQNLYVVQQLAGGTAAYNIAGVYRIRGTLDSERLERAFASLLQRHEPLRTSFAVEDGEFVQRVHERVPFAIRRLKAAEDELDRLLPTLIEPFDPGRAPLLRVALVALAVGEANAEPEHLLVVDMHHLISDGVSSAILMRDLLDLYEGKDLPPLRVQYKDYAVWLGSPSAQEAIGRQESYWLNALAGELPAMRLPTDFLRPPVQSYEGAYVQSRLDADTTARLKAIAADSGSTLYMVLLTGFIALLAKLTGQSDIRVGTPAAGRRHADLQEMLGMFVNTLVIRARAAEDRSFVEMLDEVKETALLAFDNQDYPFEQLVEKLRLPRDVSRNPLFDAMFVWQNFDKGRLEAHSLDVKPHPFRPSAAKFDLRLEADEEDGQVVFLLDYAVKLYREETARKLLDDYAKVLEELSRNPQAKLRDIAQAASVVGRRRAIVQEIEFNF